MLVDIIGIILIDSQFVMNHLDDLDPKRGISWQTVQVPPFPSSLSSPAQFMLAEVQYGGRVTDDFDKRLLNTFTNVWFNDQLLVTGFKFYDGYTLPDCKTVEEYSEFITNLPIQVQTHFVKAEHQFAFRIFPRCLAFMPTQTSPTRSTPQREC